MRHDLKAGGRRVLIVLLLIVGDMGAFYLSLWTAYSLRTHVLGAWFPLPFSQTFPDLLLRFWIPLVVTSVFAYEGLYSKRAPFWEETRQIVRSLFFAYITIFAIVSLGKMSSEVSRATIIGTGILSLIFVPLVRFWWKPFLHAKGLGIKKTILIGDNAWGRLAHLGLFRDHYMGIRIVGQVSLDETLLFSSESVAPLSGETAPELPFLGTLSELPAIVDSLGIRGAVVALPDMRRESLSPLIDEIQRHVLSVYLVPNISQVNLVNSELTYLFYEEIFLLGVHNNLKSRVNRGIKDLSDMVLALLLSLPLLPIIALLGILVALSSPSPVFFSQRRIGKKGRPFCIYKFRTMVEGAEGLLEKMLEGNPELKKEFSEKQKLASDPRITKIGKFLRRTSLDELPQIINVLKGEMSFVGPRPVTREELDCRYRESAESYQLVKPGITGLWQVSGRSERGYKMRVRLDLWYIRNWSLWLDMVILVRTVGVVFRKKGAF
ncbi:MAG: undecaprenyl-phosphate galactose phosphotransferase WbaP [Leptospirales bacterium]